MTQSPNILNELKELNSSLAGMAAENAYTVPAGYFESLLGELMNRIRAMEASNPKDELDFLAPVLNDISRQMPYSVPDDYFTGLAESALAGTKQNAGEELETISPFLAGLKKETPYSIPAGYFDRLRLPAKEESQRPSVKVVSITNRHWFRYAAAAMVIGVMAIAGITIYQNKSGNKRSLVKLENKINKEIKNSSDQELNDFLQYTDAGLDGTEKASANTDIESKELLKDIPDAELKQFIEETSDADQVPDNLKMN